MKLAAWPTILIKHFSHVVQPGAKRPDTFSLTGYENLLAFANPDRNSVITVQNDLGEELPVRVKAGDKLIAAALQPDSFNYFRGQDLKLGLGTTQGSAYPGDHRLHGV
jgi:hypothetical protein